MTSEKFLEQVAKIAKEVHKETMQIAIFGLK